MMETQPKNAAAIHMAARSPQRWTALRAIGSTERLWPHAGLIPRLQNQLASEETNSATSLKQAVSGHLREF